ncbi:MAG TPA: cation:proton antiporter [Candidatus Paceibacterota bacterium]
MNLAVVQLAVLFGLAAILGVLTRLAKQPLIIAYIATGAVAGLFGFFNLIEKETFHLFADLGVTILLFLVGLEINYSNLRLVGRPSVIVGLGQVILASLGGYAIARGFHFPPLSALYIGLALSFSSTIIVVQLLSDKKDLQSLYGKISIGMMLVQDVVTIFLLIFLAGIDTGAGVHLANVLYMIFKGVLIFVAMLWLGRRVLPLLFDRLARSPQLLFLISLAWMLIVAAFVSILGFSVEIGGFLAGIALANSSEHYAIGSRLRPLRDFFIFAFFVLLGTSLSSFSMHGLSLPIIILSIFVLIGNPLIVLILMGSMGYRRKTSFLAGITTAQVSEFSLILVALGAKLNHIDKSVVALVSAVAVVSILLSTYLVVYGDTLARKINKLLKYFERSNLVENNIPEDGFHKPVVLIGAHRTGASLMQHIKKEDLLVIDSDPDVVRKYRKEGFDCLLGSTSDEDILEIAGIDQARVIISTSPSFEDNKGLLEIIKKIQSSTKVILRAEDEMESEFFYRNGADYVIFPHQSSGHLLGKEIADDPDLNFLADMRKKDFVNFGLKLRD